MITSIEELNRVRDECKSMVTKRSLASAAAAAVPVPAADVGADIAILAELLPAINRRFGLTPEQVDTLDPQLKAKLAVIITSLGSGLIGSVITKEAIVAVFKKVGVRVATKSVAKYIPLIGTAIASTVSFGAMKWMGNAHVDDCYEALRQLLTNEEPAPEEAQASLQMQSLPARFSAA